MSKFNELDAIMQTYSRDITPITESWLSKSVSHIIVNRDMVWKLGKFQRVYNEIQCYVESASPCTNLLKFWQLIFQQYG